MTALVGIFFLVMASFALASAFTGALMVLGLAERHWTTRAIQRLFLSEAVVFCVLGLAVAWGTGG